MKAAVKTMCPLRVVPYLLRATANGPRLIGLVFRCCVLTCLVILQCNRRLAHSASAVGIHLIRDKAMLHST